jgi:hypothetical protein
MPSLAFCGNCGSDRLHVGGPCKNGIEISCYVCTYKAVVEGVILGEIDFLAGAKTKVDAMVARARDDAATGAKKPFAPKAKV